MFSPIIIIDSTSDSSESRLCELKPSIPDNPESGGFSAELKGVEYLPGKKMDVVALYGSIHEEIFISVIIECQPQRVPSGTKENDF